MKAIKPSTFFVCVRGGWEDRDRERETRPKGHVGTALSRMHCLDPSVNRCLPIPSPVPRAAVGAGMRQAVDKRESSSSRRSHSSRTDREEDER